MRFVIRDPKKASPGSSENAPARCGAETQHIAPHSAAVHTRCCVSPLPRGPARSSGKQRYDYFSAVVHFRKVSDSVKVGSGRKGHPVIAECGYISACYYHDNNYGMDNHLVYFSDASMSDNRDKLLSGYWRVKVSHTFQQVIFGLKLIHEELWFSTKSDLDELWHCDKWRGSEICSTGGRLLAKQVGHPDEWEYTILYLKPDTGLIIDEPDEDSAVSDAFLAEVRFRMTMLVHPYIDDNGLFLPEDEGSGDCYSG